MKCPKCNVTLLLAERQGVEIDYCPECRGIWLDRGELDKILDKVAAEAAPRQAPQPVPQPQVQPGFGRQPEHDPRREVRYDDRQHKGHKKKNLLEDLFDF